MVSRLMLNLRREALRRKPILDYRVTHPGGDGADSQEVARFAVMTSTWAMEPEGEMPNWWVVGDRQELSPHS